METGLTEEDLLECAKKERLDIVARYDLGREEGAVIDPWEDPEYEVYHSTDRYGFIHDSRLPQARSKEEEKRLVTELSRLSKWTKMLKTWDKYANSEKLIKRVHKGIPDRYRGEIWTRLLQIDQVKKEQRGKYEEMKALGRKWSPDVRQIDLDVNRTYRDHTMFRLRYNVKQQQLFHLLVSYSMYNQEVGYCQGMSQIAALLLMYLNEEDAFWALSTLMSDSKYAMHGFFIPGFPKLLRYQQHHDKILEKFLPKLKKHMERNYVDSGLYTLKWFFQCFLDRVPFTLTLRLWDIFLVEGDRLMIAMAYNILKLHRRQISHLDMDQILEYIQKRLEVNFGYDDDYVIENLEKLMEELKRSKLEYPGPPPDAELPQNPFGMFIEPSLEKSSGARRAFTDAEKRVTEHLLERIETIESNGKHLSVDQGSRYSLECSIDDVSSLCIGGSRASLANTSVTSAADLSTFSSATLAHQSEADNNSVQSGRSLISPAFSSIIYSQIPRSASQSPPHKSHWDSQTRNKNHALLNGEQDSPSSSPFVHRPFTLSISQTNLQLDSLPSEPVTPRAIESIDTVRIFVPFCESKERLRSPHDVNVSLNSCDLKDPNKITIRIDLDESQLVQEKCSPLHLHRKERNQSMKPITLDSPEYNQGLA